MCRLQTRDSVVFRDTQITYCSNSTFHVSKESTLLPEAKIPSMEKTLTFDLLGSGGVGNEGS